MSVSGGEVDHQKTGGWRVYSYYLPLRTDFTRVLPPDA